MHHPHERGVLGISPLERECWLNERGLRTGAEAEARTASPSGARLRPLSARDPELGTVCHSWRAAACPAHAYGEMGSGALRLPRRVRKGTMESMQKLSLDSLARQELKRAANTESGRARKPSWVDTLRCCA